MAAEPTTGRIPIRDLVRYYLRLGVLGFGGPVALVGAAFVITVAVRAEVALVFIGCGIVDLLYCGSLFRGFRAGSTSSLIVGGPLVAAGVSEGSFGALLGKLLVFFLKAGSLPFG